MELISDDMVVLYQIRQMTLFLWNKICHLIIEDSVLGGVSMSVYICVNVCVCVGGAFQRKGRHYPETEEEKCLGVCQNSFQHFTCLAYHVYGERRECCCCGLQGGCKHRQSCVMN